MPFFSDSNLIRSRNETNRREERCRRPDAKLPINTLDGQAECIVILPGITVPGELLPYPRPGKIALRIRSNIACSFAGNSRAKATTVFRSSSRKCRILMWLLIGPQSCFGPRLGKLAVCLNRHIMSEISNGMDILRECCPRATAPAVACMLAS